MEGNTAWVLASAALVLFMTPGLAFFYGGMVRSKNVLGMLMQNFFCMGLVSVAWALVVFSLAFGGEGRYIGDFAFVGLKTLGNVKTVIPSYKGDFALAVPAVAFCAFQLMFAIITPALITGAIADRMKFRAWVVFLGAWLVLVYAPVAHWVFAPAGWLFHLGALDFAGGTVVHINAGIAALAVILVLGKRRGWPNETMPPHSLPFTLLGTGILWFGWFGFNAGSALAANGLAAQAFLNTNNAAAAAMLGWLVVERLKGGHATTLGAASGAVAGLVAITPCAGYVGGLSPILIGFAAGAVCFLAIQLKFRLGYDDALDVIGVHLVGGILGSLMVGLFADRAVNPLGGDGLLFGGGLELLGYQAVAVLATVVWSGGISFVLAKVISGTIGLRCTDEEEAVGLDLTQHAETAYSFGELGSMGRTG
ncbi:MAG: ammonium transporter, Amt family [Actinomycetota bacterium]|jgi:Amt family ammonium transporter|nr:ammonium transporter, Amt family [Actinomycetota bacterium]